MGRSFGASIHVLHVDDEPNLVEMASEFLEREDDRFEVMTATSADQGLEQLADEQIDCIVSDYDMPGTDGLEFLESVRGDYPDLPFILYTGKGSEEIASEAISVGVTDYLQKEAGPHQYTVLANRITNCVSQYRAEQETTATKDRFGKLLKESADFIFTVDVEGTIQYSTPSIERVLGYTPEELLGTDAFELVHPDDIETAREGFTTVLDAFRSETTVEFRSKHRDGSWRWLEVRGRNLLDDPVIDGIAMNVRDVTERKEGEEALHASEERLRTLFDQSADAVFLHNADGVIREANQQASEMLGYDYDELVDKTIWEIAADPDQDSVRERWNEMAPDDTAMFEGRHERADGSTFPVEVNVGTVDLDDGVQYIATVRDVTERKEYEQRLREERDRRAALFENAPFPMVEVRIDEGASTIEAVNTAFEEVFGYDAKVVVGQTPLETLVPNDQREQHRERKRRVLDGECIDEKVQARTVAGVREFLLCVTPIWRDGVLKGSYSWFLDIGDLTERVDDLERRETVTANI